MPLGEKNIKKLTGVGLVLVTLATRLPFISKTLFEFDSVNFAVATFRFSLPEVTPHMPGYILHILLARFFLLFTSDHNTAFVTISVLLSAGSVLFLWRAAAWLRGERVGLIAAILWIFTPMFWFYGEVATAYIYEAFFASAILYFGIRLLREAGSSWLGVALAITLSFAASARQSSILFFAPAIVYVLSVVKTSRTQWLKIASVFFFFTAVWVIVLLAESGGIIQYLEAAKRENLYREQSVLFGNPLNEHLATIGKVLFYLAIGSLPVIIILIYAPFLRLFEYYGFVRRQFGKSSFRFVSLVALPALLFYIGIYFMKAGYLLNILPSFTLIGSITLDEVAMWLSKRKKAAYKDILTRPLIIRYTTILLSIIIVFDLVWFFVPFEGKGIGLFTDVSTRETFIGSIEVRYTKEQGKMHYFLNKCFAYSSVQGIKAIDSINKYVLSILKEEKGKGPVVVIDSWWQRMAYYYDHDAVTYNIKSLEADTILYKSKQYEYTNTVIDTLEYIPVSSKVLLFLRNDHPDYPLIASQVKLTRLSEIPHLDIYRIEDSSFSLRWKNLLFVKK
jgi:hypothetical protein